MATLLWVVVQGVPAAAQVQGLPRPAAVPTPAPPAATQAPEDPLGRTTPYGTVVAFLRAADRRDFARAAEYLDTKLTGDARTELARQLSDLINTEARITVDALSRDPEGTLDDGLRRTRERVGTIAVEDASLELLLDRVQRADDPPVWLFSPETLQEVPDFRERVSTFSDWIARWVPRGLVDRRFLGIEIYRWIAFPIGIMAALVLASLAARAFLLLLGRVLRRATRRGIALQVRDFSGPVRLLAFALAVSIGARVGVTLLTRYFWEHLAGILLVAALTWFMVRVSGGIAQHVSHRLSQAGQQHRLAVVRLFAGVGKSLIVIVGSLVILELLGFDLTAVAAGLGIGGLALAFAAQKTIENLFGTVMIVTDQPVRIGDFCRVGETLGTIEDVGLRSTRIRTLDRTVVSVPNGQMASMVLENFGLRDRFWFRHGIGLRYETTSDQMQRMLSGTRRLLQEHPKVVSDSARVRFVKFGSWSLDVEVFAYVLAQDYAAFLETQEELLLRLMAIIEECGTAVAFPSQTTYLARDTGRMVAAISRDAPKTD